MDITKDLSEMKQGNKQPFSTFTSGFEEKNVRNGGDKLERYKLQKRF